MRIDRPQQHRCFRNDLSEENVSFIERLPSSSDLPHCCAAIYRPPANGMQFSFRFQESSQSPILHRFFPETPSKLASPKNWVSECPSPPSLGNHPNRSREYWRANTSKELDSVAFGRHTSQTLALQRDGPYSYTRNEASHRESNRRLLPQGAGDTELKGTKDETIAETTKLPDATVMPARKRLFTQEKPNDLLLRLQSLYAPKELERAPKRNAYEQMLSAQIIGGAFGNMSGDESRSNSKTGIEWFEDHGGLKANRRRCGSHLPEEGDALMKTVRSSNASHEYREQEQELCLDLTLSSHPISNRVGLPIAPHIVRLPVHPDIGYHISALKNESEGPRGINREWELLNPVTACSCNLNHNGFDDTAYELKNPQHLHHSIRPCAAWAVKCRQRKVDDICATSQSKECAGESINFRVRNGTCKGSSTVSAPFREEHVLCTDEKEFPFNVAFPEVDVVNFIKEDERLLCNEPTLPSPSSVSPIAQQHAEFTTKKVKVDPVEFTQEGSSKEDGETETENSAVQGSVLESKVSYEPTSTLKTQITTTHADRRGGSDSLDTTEYSPIFAWPFPNNLEAQFDGTGWSEDSTCRSKPANGNMEKLPSTISSQTSKTTDGDGYAMRPANTHGALDLLVDAVQVALCPITEGCAVKDDRQESPKAGTFLHGGILIPQRRVNRQARSRGRRKKVFTLEPVQGKVQIVQADKSACPPCNENGSSSQAKAQSDIDPCDKDFGSSLSLISSAGKKFFDPFIESKRGRIRTLPSKFSDSILEPWKKGIWKKCKAQQL